MKIDGKMFTIRNKNISTLSHSFRSKNCVSSMPRFFSVYELCSKLLTMTPRSSHVFAIQSAKHFSHCINICNSEPCLRLYLVIDYSSQSNVYVFLNALCLLYCVYIGIHIFIRMLFDSQKKSHDLKLFHLRKRMRDEAQQQILIRYNS